MWPAIAPWLANIQDIDMFAQTPLRDLVRYYDRLAPDYDKLHRRWLRYAGGEAQAALEGVVRAIALPHTDLLDAGCGTGALARALIAEGISPSKVTLLDPSGEMLARCADIHATKVKGRLEALPFQDGQFDIVTCAWALETTPQFGVALTELCRVIRPGGALCLAFCADMPTRGIADNLMRHTLSWRGSGQFLSREKVVEALVASQEFDVRIIPSKGPAATLLARRKVKADAVPASL
jgi:ubiquinone/menaquinone biosynthesis C-methylase UbiE